MPEPLTPRRQIISLSLALLTLATIACSFGSVTPATPSNTPSTPEATLPPIAPGTFVPTRALPTATPILPVTDTPTPTLTSTAEPPTQPPQASGPLDFSVSIVGCRPDPTRDGGVILTMRIDAQGGNGVYTYYRENQRIQRISERPATKGSAVIDAYRVESGDGQQVARKERFTGNQFGCP